ncbi:hypothetical protein A2U01_0085053, partial [Trifolium medium]|nr:hypothetical protein [Trifolium medium]
QGRSEEGRAIGAQNRDRTNNHHKTTAGDLDNGGAEGRRRSSHHHPVKLHHTRKVWSWLGEDMQKTF